MLVLPFIHWYVTPAYVLAVMVTLCPAQKVVGPLSVTVGLGLLMTVNAAMFDVALHTPPCVITTV